MLLGCKTYGFRPQNLWFCALKPMLLKGETIGFEKARLKFRFSIRFCLLFNNAEKHGKNTGKNKGNMEKHEKRGGKTTPLKILNLN